MKPPRYQDADYLSLDPFSGDDSDRSHVKFSLITSRKAHHCPFCNKNKRKGTRMFCEAAMVEGTFQRNYACLPSRQSRPIQGGRTSDDCRQMTPGQRSFEAYSAERLRLKYPPLPKWNEFGTAFRAKFERFAAWASAGKPVDLCYRLSFDLPGMPRGFDVAWSACK